MLAGAIFCLFFWHLGCMQCSVSLFLVVSTSAIDCPERLVSEMTYYVLSSWIFSCLMQGLFTGARPPAGGGGSDRGTTGNEWRCVLWCSQDVLIHIRDISHPDAVAQKANVLQTLEQQNVDSKLLDNMIEVCNKVDKLDPRYCLWSWNVCIVLIRSPIHCVSKKSSHL